MAENLTHKSYSKTAYVELAFARPNAVTFSIFELFPNLASSMSWLCLHIDAIFFFIFPPLSPSLLPSLPPFLPHSLPPTLVPTLPHSLPPSLPPSFPPSLSCSHPHSLTHFLPPFLTPSPTPSLQCLPASLPHSLPPFLTPSLHPSLHSFLTPSLPASLPHSFSPSLLSQQVLKVLAVCLKFPDYTGEETRRSSLISLLSLIGCVWPRYMYIEALEFSRNILI